jgi:sorbitol/mannitol transport system substrate-binding protein
VQQSKLPQSVGAFTLSFALLLGGCASQSASALNDTKQQGGTTLTAAVVNNPQMVDMERLAGEFTRETGVHITFTALPENTLREKITGDAATGGGQFDLATVGSYEVPIWAKNGWLVNLDPQMAKLSPAERGAYDINDILPSVRKGLSYDGSLYALPFYAESSMTYYNKRLFNEAHLTMPEHPAWTQIAAFADKLTDKSKGRYGIVMRGLPGWGEMGAPLTTVINTFGGSWFDEHWQPQLTSQATRKAIGFYVDLLRRDGPPGSQGNGYTECETLFSQGAAAIWVDSTAAAGPISDPKISKNARDVGFAFAPTEVTPKGSHWLWVWSLAIEPSSKHKDEALRFLTWATNKRYVALAARRRGWENVPPGTRVSTFEQPGYKKAAPYGSIVLASIRTADPTNATLRKVPYVGVQYVGIPEFEGIGTRVTQDLAAVLTGSEPLDAALERAQSRTERAMRGAGYLQ